MLSDKEIAAIDANAQTFAQFSRAIIAAYQAKLLAGVEMPNAFSMEDDQLTYTADQLQQYGDARDQAGYLRGLETALIKVTGLSVDVERCKQMQLTTQAWEEALDDAAAAIDRLNEGE